MVIIPTDQRMPLRNGHVGATLHVGFRKAEIEEVDLLLGGVPRRGVTEPNGNVLGLHVPVKEPAVVHRFQPLDRLHGDQQHGAQREPPVARCLEQVSQRGAQKLHDHNVEITLLQGKVKKLQQ